MQPPYQHPPAAGPVEKRAPVITLRRGVALGILGGAMFVSCGIGAVIGTGDTTRSTSTSKPVARPAVTATVTVTVTAAPGQAAAAPAPTPTSASGPPGAAMVRLPNLVGKNGAIARDTLERLGIKNVQWASGDRADGSVVVLPANWRVTKMEPGAGTRVDPADLVVLTAVKVG